MFDKTELLGQFEPASHPDFVSIQKQSSEETNHYLRKEVVRAWELMQQAAKIDGIDLYLVSSTRNFERQKQIWENKWFGRSLTQGMNLAENGMDAFEKAQSILKFSAMPGTSRHHWGTDIDINSIETGYFETIEGINLYAWLNKHAQEFGFFQPYTKKGENRQTGYEEEQWHWSYAPLSIEFFKNYVASITYQDIDGFAGHETAQQLLVIENFVCGISLEFPYSNSSVKSNNSQI